MRETDTNRYYCQSSIQCRLLDFCHQFIIRCLPPCSQTVLCRAWLVFVNLL